MAMEKINLVTKLNKGTSKDEWGNFNYWGYKAPDGIVRARLFAPDGDDGLCELTVKKFVLQPGSWRRKVTWDDATNIGTTFVKIPDTVKGFTSAEAIKQVNAIIEIHNDYFDEHVGRKVRVQGYGGQYEVNPREVTGVHFTINSKDQPLVTLFGHGWTQTTDKVVDYTNEFAKQRVLDEIAKFQKNINESQAFIDRCMAANANGERITREKTGYGSKEGLIDNGSAEQLVNLINQFAPEEVTA